MSGSYMNYYMLGGTYYQSLIYIIINIFFNIISENVFS